jgi:HEAT repeat protein
MALIKREKQQAQVYERRHSRDREGLIAQLDSPSDFERRMAARDLAEQPDVSEALCRRLGIEEASPVRAVLFSSLTQIGDAAAVAGLMALLRSEDAELRCGSIEALKCLPDQIGTHIQTLLHDDDPDVRIFIVNILEALPHPDVPHWLCQVIEEEREVNVCAAAIDLLAELGTADMVPALLAVKGRFAGTPYIAFAVDLTIERIDGASVIELPGGAK